MLAPHCSHCPYTSSNNGHSVPSCVTSLSKLQACSGGEGYGIPASERKKKKNRTKISVHRDAGNEHVATDGSEKKKAAVIDICISFMTF